MNAIKQNAAKTLAGPAAHSETFYSNDSPVLQLAQCHRMYFIGVCCPDGHIERQGKHIVDYDEALARLTWLRRRDAQLNLYSRRISDSLVLEPTIPRGRT